MDEYVPKPINQERLREVVRSLGHPRPGARTGAARAAEGPDDSDPPAADADDLSLPPPFDREELMSRIESDVELLGALVHVFRTDRLNLLGAMEEALDAEDPAALAAAAHTIKGALAVFGAEPARALAEKLERTGREGNIDGARTLLDELRQAVVAAEEGLEALLLELA